MSSLAHCLIVDDSWLIVMLAMFLLVAALFLAVPALLTMLWMNDIETELNERGHTIPEKWSIDYRAGGTALKVMFWTAVSLLGSWVLGFSQRCGFSTQQ